MNNHSTSYPASLQALIPINTPQLLTLSMPEGITPDHIRAVFHQMYIVRSKQSRLDEEDRPNYYNDNYVPLNAEMMYLLLSKRYRIVLNWMEEQGFISVYLSANGKRSYIPGERSMLYRINPKLLTPNSHGKHFRIEKITKRSLIKSICVNHSRYGFDDTKLAKLSPVLPQLRKMCSLAYFLSDKAWEWMQQSTTDVEIKPIHRSLLFFQMEMHNSKEFVDFHVDSFGFRAHTTFTSLKKELRQFIRFKGYDNERVVLVDLKNSQPYFSSLIIRHPKLLEQFLPEFLPLKSIIEQGTEDGGVKFFHKICAEGLLYRDWLLARNYLQDEKAELTPELKTKAKDEILAMVMYGTNGNYADNKEVAYNKKMTKLMFNQQYGKTGEIFSAIKRVGADILPFMDRFYTSKEGKYVGIKAAHKNLSAMMQRMESRILLEFVGQKLIANGLVFTTVHDCFILPESHGNTAKNLIHEAFTELGVIPPSLHSDWR